jgi:hypothetical protein
MIYAALANACVALRTRRCRVMASFFAVALIANSTVWALSTEPTFRAQRVCGLGLPDIQKFLHQVMALAFVFLVPRQHSVPVDVEYHTSKFTIMQMLFVGQIVIALHSVGRSADSLGRSEHYSCSPKSARRRCGQLLITALHSMLLKCI